MTYTCDNHEGGPRPAYMIITLLSNGETITPCEECLTLFCIGHIQALADADAAGQAAMAGSLIADPPEGFEVVDQTRAPATAATAQEDEGAAQTPPPPKRGRTRREAAQTAAQEVGEEDPALPGAEHDG